MWNQCWYCKVLSYPSFFMIWNKLTNYVIFNTYKVTHVCGLQRQNVKCCQCQLMFTQLQYESLFIHQTSHRFKYSRISLKQALRYLYHHQMSTAWLSPAHLCSPHSDWQIIPKSWMHREIDLNWVGLQHLPAGLSKINWMGLVVCDELFSSWSSQLCTCRGLRILWTGSHKPSSTLASEAQWKRYRIVLYWISLLATKYISDRWFMLRIIQDDSRALENNRKCIIHFRNNMLL